MTSSPGLTIVLKTISIASDPPTVTMTLSSGLYETNDFDACKQYRTMTKPDGIIYLEMRNFPDCTDAEIEPSALLFFVFLDHAAHFCKMI